MLFRRPGSRFAAVMWFVLASIGGLSACAGPGAQIVYLQFRPPTDPAFSSAFTVGLAPFQDTRPSPQVLGRRVRVDGSIEPIMLGSPTPARDLTHMLIRYLEARGAQVVDLGAWKPDPENLRDLPGDVRMAMTGRIDALEVVADSTVFKSTVKYRVRLTAYLGLVDKGEILTRSMEISPQKTSFQFDVREIEDELNKALMEAIGRIMEGVLPSSF